jgi:hypothetical protein
MVRASRSPRCTVTDDQATRGLLDDDSDGDARVA